MRERKTIFCGVLGARTHACKVCLSVELIERGRAGFHMKPTFSHHPRIVKILLLHYTSAEAVALAITYGCPICEDLGYPVWASRPEGCLLILRHLLCLTEHFAAGGLK